MAVTGTHLLVPIPTGVQEVYCIHPRPSRKKNLNLLRAHTKLSDVGGPSSQPREQDSALTMEV